VVRVAAKLVGFRIEEELLKRLKHAAVDQEISLQELFTRAAVAYLKTMPKEPNEAARGVK
jgi:hypothetical protein